MRRIVMKANVRKIDEIASETLKVYDTARKDGFELINEGDAIIIRKCTQACALCSATRKTKNYSGKLICQDCIYVIKEIAGQLGR